MKKRIFRISLYVLGFLVIGVTSLLAYVKLALPNVGEPLELKIEATPVRLARGEYLAKHVTVCMQCHSQRDWSLFGAPSKPGTAGMGGEMHDHRLGFPGKYISKNITPGGLAQWSDGEILRAMVSGVDQKGNALFPIMPYPNFGKMDQEDIYSIIAYIRTLQPISYEPEPSESDFPMNFVINMIPAKPAYSNRPNETDKVATGAYLVSAAICSDCHTKSEGGSVVGKPFAGGMEFPLPDGSIVRAANITPHTTGIGNWTTEQFVQRFKMHADSNYVPQKVGPGDLQSVMPWDSYAGMSESDLQAIYAYLQTLDAVENQVEKFTPALATN